MPLVRCNSARAISPPHGRFNNLASPPPCSSSKVACSAIGSPIHQPRPESVPAACGTGGFDGNDWFATLAQQQREQRESLLNLKMQLESRVTRLEEQTLNSKLLSSIETMSGQLTHMKDYLDNAYIKMQDFFEKAQHELVQTAEDLTEKLRCTYSSGTLRSESSDATMLSGQPLSARATSATYHGSRQLQAAEDVHEKAKCNRPCSSTLAGNDDAFAQYDTRRLKHRDSFSAGWNSLSPDAKIDILTKRMESLFAAKIVEGKQQDPQIGTLNGHASKYIMENLQRLQKAASGQDIRREADEQGSSCTQNEAKHCTFQVATAECGAQCEMPDVYCQSFPNN